MDILNKITMRGVVGADIKELLKDIPDGKDAIEFACVLGHAQGIVKGEKPTPYGENIWIAGEFLAKNLFTNQKFYSTRLYPPQVMHDIIVAKLGGEPDERVQFAFMIGIKRSKQVVGYEFTVRSLIELKEENNPFAAIEAQIKGLPNPGGVKEPGQIPDPL